jgi:organic hydroperoxide reductase OsmC/OhrA
MMTKSEKVIPFEVKLDWLNKKKGTLSAKDAEGVLHVGTPPAFGGEGKPWTPEHYFLASISSCFMSTFFAFANKMNLPILHFECAIIGQVRFKEGRYVFTDIDLYPVITLAADSLRTKATGVLEKTHKHCIITNSVATPVFYHPEIRINNNIFTNETAK